MSTGSSTASSVARKAARRRSRGLDVLRLLTSLVLAALAVGLSYWMGRASLAGSEVMIVVAIGLAGVMAAVLSVVIVGRAGR
jgi:hypothetical protein